MLHVLDLTKANKPYGHAAYTKTSKTGKVSQVQAKGVKPSEPVSHEEMYRRKDGEFGHYKMVSDYTEKFFSKHPELEKQARVIAASPNGTKEANQSGDKIYIRPRFFDLASNIQEHVLAHEIGHAHQEKWDLKDFIDLAAKHGIDAMNVSELPWGQFNMEEAYAESFAVYCLDPNELKTRHPKWYALLADMQKLKPEHANKALTKAEKPYGHTAYERTSKTGKVSHVKAKGVKVNTSFSEKGHGKSEKKMIQHVKSKAGEIQHEGHLEDHLHQYLKDNYDHTDDAHRAADVKTLKKQFYSSGLVTKEKKAKAEPKPIEVKPETKVEPKPVVAEPKPEPKVSKSPKVLKLSINPGSIGWVSDHTTRRFLVSLDSDRVAAIKTKDDLEKEISSFIKARWPDTTAHDQKIQVSEIIEHLQNNGMLELEKIKFKPAKADDKGHLSIFGTMLHATEKTTDLDYAHARKNFLGDWYGSSNSEYSVRMRGAAVAYLCEIEPDDCDGHLERDIMAVSNARLAIYTHPNEMTKKDAREKAKDALEEGMKSKAYAKALKSLAAEAQAGLPEKVTVYRVIYGENAASIETNRYLDTGVLCSFSYSEKASRDYMANMSSYNRATARIVKITVPREAVVLHWQKHSAGAFNNEEELTIATKGRVYFDDIVKGLFDGKKTEIHYIGEVPPKGHWDPIPTRPREDPLLKPKPKPKKKPKVKKALVVDLFRSDYKRVDPRSGKIEEVHDKRTKHDHTADAKAKWATLPYKEKSKYLGGFPEIEDPTKPGHVYRGIDQNEHDYIVENKHVQSDQRYNVHGEGTVFGDDWNIAESYVNAGHTNPSFTGRPNYVIEVSHGSDLKNDPRDNYPKAQKPIAVDRITRAWRFKTRQHPEEGTWGPNGFVPKMKKALFHVLDLAKAVAIEPHHKGYTRTSRTGKVSQIKAKGIPNAEDLTHAGSGAYLGGAGSKVIYKDKEEQKWIFKHAVAKDGSGAEKPFSAHAQEAFYQIASKIKTTVPVKAIKLGGKIGTIQTLLDLHPDEPTLNSNPSKLKPSEREDIAAEHVCDWLLSQHDSHHNNFVRTREGELVGVDKEQGFRYLGKDELSENYHPNEHYGEHEPFYNKFWREWANNKFEFDPQSIAKYIDRADKIKESDFKAALQPYVQSLFERKEDQAKFLDKATKRKNDLRQDFETFITRLYKKRLGTNGKFTFESGWKVEKGLLHVIDLEKSDYQRRDPRSGKLLQVHDKRTKNPKPRYNPDYALTPEEETTVALWQVREGERDKTPKMVGPARTRGLHRLVGKTKTKLVNGKRFYLMHRGMSEAEAKATVGDTHVTNDKVTSWTPLAHAAPGEFMNLAHHFATEYGGEVVSAWISEDSIRSMLPMWGRTNMDKLEQDKFDKEGGWDTVKTRGPGYQNKDWEIILDSHHSAKATKEEIDDAFAYPEERLETVINERVKPGRQFKHPALYRIHDTTKEDREQPWDSAYTKENRIASRNSRRDLIRQTFSRPEHHATRDRLLSKYGLDKSEPLLVIDLVKAAPHHKAYDRRNPISGIISHIQQLGIQINPAYEKSPLDTTTPDVVAHVKASADKILTEKDLETVLADYLKEKIKDKATRLGKVTEIKDQAIIHGLAVPFVLPEKGQPVVLPLTPEGHVAKPPKVPRPPRPGSPNKPKREIKVNLIPRSKPSSEPAAIEWTELVGVTSFAPLFKTFPQKNTELIVNGKKVAPPSLDAELCAQLVAGRLAGEASGKTTLTPKFKENMQKSMYEHWGIPIGSKLDFSLYDKRRIKEKEAKKPAKKENEPIKVRCNGIETNVLAGQGAASIVGGALYGGASDPEFHGQYVKIVSMKDDCTWNGSGEPPPGWTGKKMNEPTKRYCMVYRHPLLKNANGEGRTYHLTPASLNKAEGGAVDKNFDHVFSLAEQFPLMRAKQQKDFTSPDKEVRACAVVAYFLDKANIRVGSDEGFGYGVTTLEGRHITWEGENKIRFQFVGKSRVKWDRTLILPPEVTKAFKAFHDAAGPEDQIFPVKNSRVNDYLRPFGGMTAKNIRTWHANRYLHAYMDAMEIARKKHGLTAKDMESLWMGIKKDKNRKLAKIIDGIRDGLAPILAPGLQNKKPYADKKGNEIAGIVPYVAHLMGHNAGTDRKSYIDPRRFMRRCAVWGFDARVKDDIDYGRYTKDAKLKKSLASFKQNEWSKNYNINHPEVFNTDLLESEYEFIEDLRIDHDIRDEEIQKSEPILYIDLSKGRRKGSRNKDPLLAISTYFDSKGNKKYVYAHEKELDESGVLVPEVPAAAVIRRHYGEETKEERDARRARGIKDPKDTGEWVTNPYTKNPVKLAKPIGVVTGFEVDDKYKNQFRRRTNPLTGKLETVYPKNISKFFTTPEELARIAAIQALSPKPDTKKVPHVLVPAVDEAGAILLDINGKPIIVGTHGKKATSDKPPLVAVGTEGPYVVAGTGIHPSDPLHRVDEVPLKIPTPKKVDKPLGYEYKVVEVLKDPLILAKFNNDLGLLQAEARDRPYSLWMTAGLLGGPHLHPTASKKVMDEWARDIYRLAAAETSRFKDTAHAKGAADTALPQPKGGLIQHFIKNNASDYAHGAVEEAIVNWLPKYNPHLTDPKKSFNRYIISKVGNYVRDRIKKDLREKENEVLLSGDESELGRPDIGQGSKVMSPHEYAEYKHYAKLGTARIAEAIRDLPESYQRIIAARLWLDSSESEKEERVEIERRAEIGADGREEPWRSIQSVLQKHPDGWPFKVDLSTVNGKMAAGKALLRHYQKAIHRLAQKLTLGAIDLQHVHAGNVPDGVVFDSDSGQYFTKENYAAKRYLTLEAKRLRAGKSTPGDFSFFTKLATEEMTKKQRKAIPKLIPWGEGRKAGRLLSTHGPSTVKKLLPAVDYFERRPELAAHLGFDKYGPLTMPTSLFTHKPTTHQSNKYGAAKMPVLVTTLTGKQSKPRTIEPITMRPHYKYGLPQVEAEHRPMVLQPEPARRLAAMKEAHSFMMRIGRKPTKEVATLRDSTVIAVGKINAALGTDTPQSLVASMTANVLQLGSPDPDRRIAAGKALLGQAGKLFIVEHYTRIAPDKAVAAHVRGIVGTPIVSTDDGQQRVKSLLALGMGETAGLIDNKRQSWQSYIKMMDFELARRPSKKTKKSLTDHFENLLFDLDFEIGMFKAGEGSRGGKVIGHTKRGKPVYQDESAPRYAYHQTEPKHLASIASSGLQPSKHWNKIHFSEHKDAYQVYDKNVGVKLRFPWPKDGKVITNKQKGGHIDDYLEFHTKTAVHPHKLEVRTGEDTWVPVGQYNGKHGSFVEPKENTPSINRRFIKDYVKHVKQNRHMHRHWSTLADRGSDKEVATLAETLRGGVR